MGNWIDLRKNSSLSVDTKIRRHSSASSSCSPKVNLCDFRKKGLIGSGRVSQMYLVEKIDTGKNFAMKVMKKSVKYK